MFGKDRESTILLEEGMEARHSRIPENERRTACGGRGQREVGCAFTHAIYSTCIACSGTGLRKVQLENERIDQEMNALMQKQRDEIAKEYKAEFQNANFAREPDNVDWQVYIAVGRAERNLQKMCRHSKRFHQYLKGLLGNTFLKDMLRLVRKGRSYETARPDDAAKVTIIHKTWDLMLTRDLRIKVIEYASGNPNPYEVHPLEMPNDVITECLDMLSYLITPESAVDFFSKKYGMHS